MKLLQLYQTEAYVHSNQIFESKKERGRSSVCPSLFCLDPIDLGLSFESLFNLRLQGWLQAVYTKMPGANRFDN